MLNKQLWEMRFSMSLARAAILELERLDLHDFEQGQKFMRIAKQLQLPERNSLKKYWEKRVEALT